MKPAPLVAAIAVLSLAVSSGARAQSASEPAGGGPGPCKQDIATFCSGVQSGEGRIGACLKSHWKEVSAGCKDALKARRGKRNASGGTPPKDAPAADTPE